MASYQYTVTGVGSPMSLSGQASDDVAAKREAVLFLSELLRDLAVSKRGGSVIRVEVRAPQGDLVYVATANLASADNE